MAPPPTTAPDTLCRELFAPAAQLNRATLRTLFLDLSRLAGGPGNVYNYCFRYLNSLSWAKLFV